MRPRVASVLAARIGDGHREVAEHLQAEGGARDSKPKGLQYYHPAARNGKLCVWVVVGLRPRQDNATFVAALRIL